MRPSTAGLFAGLILGLALVLEGFGEMLIVALFGAIGYGVMRVVTGEVDVEDMLNRAQRRTRR